MGDRDEVIPATHTCEKNKKEAEKDLVCSKEDESQISSRSTQVFYRNPSLAFRHPCDPRRRRRRASKGAASRKLSNSNELGGISRRRERAAPPHAMIVSSKAASQ